MLNLQIYSIELHFENEDEHTGCNWVIPGTINCMNNLFQSAKLPWRIYFLKIQNQKQIIWCEPFKSNILKESLRAKHHGGEQFHNQNYTVSLSVDLWFKAYIHDHKHLSNNRNYHDEMRQQGN